MKGVLKSISPLSRSPELLLPSSKSSLTKRSDQEKGPECDSALKNKIPSETTKPVQEAMQEHRQCQLEAGNPVHFDFWWFSPVLFMFSHISKIKLFPVNQGF